MSANSRIAVEKTPIPSCFLRRRCFKRTGTLLFMCRSAQVSRSTLFKSADGMAAPCKWSQGLKVENAWR